MTLRPTTTLADIARMRRMLGTPWLVLPVGLLAGMSWFAWEAHDLGDSCGLRGIQPSFPAAGASVMLITIAAVVVVARGVSEHKRARVIAMCTAASIAATGAAIALGQLVFVLTRHCFA